MSDEINFEVAAEIQQMIEEYVLGAVADATDQLQQRNDSLEAELRWARADVTRLQQALVTVASTFNSTEQMAEVWDLAARTGLAYNASGPLFDAVVVNDAFGVLAGRNPYRDPDHASPWSATEDEFAVWYFGPAGVDDYDLVVNSLGSALDRAAHQAGAHPDVIFWVMRRTVTEWEYADVW